MVLEDVCSLLKADLHTAEGLLPLFEERRKSKSSGKDDCVELKSACGAAIVSRLLMCILHAPAGSTSTTSTEEKKARRRSSDNHEELQGVVPSSSSSTRHRAEVSATAAGEPDDSSAINNSNNSSIVDLATSLAQFLQDSCCKRGSSTTELAAAAPTAPPLTASDVVRYCTRLLSKSGIVTKLVFGEHSGGNGDEEIQEKLDQVVSMLDGIDDEIKVEMSLYKEFDEIWTWAASHEEEFFLSQLPSSFSSTMNPERKELRGPRECAWLLQCLLTLTIVSSNHTLLPEYYLKDIYLFRRSLICAAVSLLFEVVVGATDTSVEEEPARKRSKGVPGDAEQDAIAALSMMTNPTSPSSTSRIEATSRPLSQVEHIKKLFCNKMKIESDLFRSSMSLICTFINDQRGITKESLGTPKVLNILRCMYRDERLDHVYHTGTHLMGVVNHMELYHSSDIRNFLVCQNDIIPKNCQPKSTFVANMQQHTLVEPKNENTTTTTTTTEIPNEQPATVISSSSTSSLTKEAAVGSTQANNVSSWLSRLYTDPSLAKPSQSLTQHFDNSGGVALWQSITSILDRLLHRLIGSVHETVVLNKPEATKAAHGRGLSGYKKPECHHGANTAGINSLHHQIQTSVLSLYYHSLQAVLSVETKRLGSNVHTQLLSNPTFHKSLLAVGCQCVIFASSLSNGTDLQFPAVLKIMEIDPIDFLRIAECFVRALCASTVSSSTSVLAIPFELPCAIKNHLQECEELVLEKFMWESPVPSSAVRYNCIQDAIQALQHYSSDLINGILWPPLCLIDGASGKILRERNRLDILSKIPSRSLQHHYNTVSFIFRKLVTLSARRILDFSELLHLDQYVTEQIWLTWKQLLVDHIALLYDRHIDQLIICTIYGVCKIARIEPELTFARIFEAYYDLNPGRERLNEHIIRHILLGPDGQQGNVINLYNQVFVPLAKQQLWKFKYYAREKQSQASDSNLDEEVRLPFESSVYEAKCSFLPVRGLVNVAPRSRVDKTNVYVTSFSDPKSGDVNEDPRPVGPRVLYSFGDSSCYDVTHVNKTINYSRIIDSIPRPDV